MTSQSSIDSVPTVAVLLATHQPKSYIEEQIQSIQAQNGVKTKIYWGDHASSEESRAYVRRLLAGSDFVEYSIPHPGPAANFFYLLSKTTEKFIAFSDQDDIWLPEKLLSQVSSLQNSDDRPGLTHSNSQLLINGKIRTKKILCTDHTFNSLIFSNCCQGCTIMMNEKGRDAVLSSLPIDIVWHDWWIALVISLVGDIIFSEKSEVLYRLHSSNLVGIPNFFHRVVNFQKNPKGLMSYQCNEALSRFGLAYASENPDMKAILNLTSPSRYIRFRASIKDGRRRIILADEILRRFLWVLRRP